MGRSSINCYQIPPKGERYVMSEDVGIFPRTHTDYYIFNLGRCSVLVEGWYGTKISWIDVLYDKTLDPGHGIKIPVSDRPYYVTGIKIRNFSHNRALVHCSKVSGYKLWVDGSDAITPDINVMAKQLVPFGVGDISTVEINLDSLLSFFWPNQMETYWDKISKQIISLLDGQTQAVVQKVLRQDISYIREKLNVIQSQIRTHQPSKVKADYFLQTVESLAFVEKKFSGHISTHSDHININFYLLPLYTATVNFKLILLTFGIKNPRAIGLTDEQIGVVYNFLEKLIHDPNLGAVDHVTKTFKEKFHKEYESCDQELIYNTLATVRTWCGITGFEFIPFWRNVLEGFSGKGNNDVITYSTYWGRPSPYLSYQLVTDDIAPPLQPRLINGQRNKIKGVYVYIWRSNSGQGAPMIGGLKVMYKNNDCVETGKPTSEANYINFGNNYLKKLTAWGGDAINCLEFTFSNGHVESYGTKENAQGTRKFKLKNHHIVGFYMANDVPGLGGQAANISVAFQVLLN